MVLWRILLLECNGNINNKKPLEMTLQCEFIWNDFDKRNILYKNKLKIVFNIIAMILTPSLTCYIFGIYKWIDIRRRCLELIMGINNEIQALKINSLYTYEHFMFGVQSAWDAKYTDCISAEKLNSLLQTNVFDMTVNGM